MPHLKRSCCHCPRSWWAVDTQNNALLRELKATVKKLMQAVKNSLPAMAEKLEMLRQNMIIYRYQLLHIATSRNKLHSARKKKAGIDKFLSRT